MSRPRAFIGLSVFALLAPLAAALADDPPPRERGDRRPRLAGPRPGPHHPPPDAEQDPDAGGDFEPGPGPDRHHQGPMGEWPGRFLDAKAIEELIAFAREHFPEHAERLQALREEDPRAFRRVAGRVFPRLRHMKALYDRDPQGLGRLVIEDHKLDMQIRDLARRYREAPPAERAALGEELRGVLDRQWAVRQERRGLELGELEKRLAEQRARLADRAARRAEMVQQQFDRLTGEKDVDW